MTTSNPLQLTDATVDPCYITLHLADGRVLKVPLTWFPRVAAATPADQQDFEILAGRGIAWFRLGEDLTVKQVLNGQGSSEPQASFSTWYATYKQGQTPRPFGFLPTDVFD